MHDMNTDMMVHTTAVHIIDLHLSEILNCEILKIECK